MLFLKIAILFIFFCALNAQQASFFGETSLTKYFQQNCRHFAIFNVKTIIVSNLILNSPLKHTQNRSLNLHSYLNSLKCAHLFLNNITILQLATTLATFQGGKLQIIFNLANYQFNQTTFNETLSTLSFLHFNCYNCQQFIITFDSLRNAPKWTNASMPYFHKYFQAIFLNHHHLDNYIHLNPILDGCFFYKGIYVPKTKQQFERLKVPFRKCNLNQIKINVSINKNYPFCSFNKNAKGDIEPHYSIDLELLNYMKTSYNFTVDFVDANNSWSGLIGQIANGTSEFGLCEIGITKERLKVVDFTAFTFLDQIVFISQSPITKNQNLFYFSKISSEIQIGIGVSFIILFISIKYAKSFQRKSPFNYEENFFVEPIIIQLLGVFLKEVIDGIFKEPFTSLRILYTVWMFACFVLSNIYSSIFYSMITVPEFALPIDSMEQFLKIAQTDTHQIIIKSNTAIEDYISNAQPGDGVYYILRGHFARGKPEMLEHHSDAIPRLEADSRLLFIYTRNSLSVKRYLYSTKPLHISSEALESVPICWAVRKRSPLLAPFSCLIKRQREMGILDYLFQSTVRKMASKMALNQAHFRARVQASIFGNALMKLEETSQSIHTILLDDLSPVFLIWAIGCAFASGTFLLQIVCKWNFLKHCQLLSKKNKNIDKQLKNSLPYYLKIYFDNCNVFYAKTFGL